MIRLDRRDAYLLEFTATVVAARADGDAAWVRLDASAFYPTSGGQPHDVGTLDDRPVEDVTVDDEGAVWHRVPGAADDWPAGRSTVGRVDGERRARHRQRHSAQHLLSQAFVRVDPAFATRSVALGTPDLTVDLAGSPDDDAIAAAERLANEAAYAAWPVRALEVDEADLARYPLRRPPKVTGRVRLVAMGPTVGEDPASAWELSACGGTHVRTTAEVAPIVTLRRERIRGDLTRVTFRAGWDAWADHHVKHDAASRAAVSLSTSVTDLPDAVTALQEALATARRDLAQARAARAADRADDLLGGDPAAGALVVAELGPDDADLLGPLADALALRGATAVLGVVHGERAEVIAVSGDDVDVRAALGAALTHLGGRGGGKPARAQGSGPDVERLAEALAAAHDVLTTA